MWCHVVISARISVWSTVIQGSFPPISVFLYLRSWKPFPGSLPPAQPGDPVSSVEGFKCLQGLALRLGLRPLVESWPWGLFDFFKKKKKKKEKKKLWLKYHFYCLFSQVFFFSYSVFQFIFSICVIVFFSHLAFLSTSTHTYLHL